MEVVLVAADLYHLEMLLLYDLVLEDNMIQCNLQNQTKRECSSKVFDTKSKMVCSVLREDWGRNNVTNSKKRYLLPACAWNQRILNGRISHVAFIYLKLEKGSMYFGFF
mmetsp:Transcript_10532/g.13751  ORF Transcript_10532/g.13751 Transcript_10532/m.13751 type:complete len:109 (+) Transcript_10532:422-748(+)